MKAIKRVKSILILIILMFVIGYLIYTGSLLANDTKTLLAKVGDIKWK